MNEDSRNKKPHLKSPGSQQDAEQTIYPLREWANTQLPLVISPEEIQKRRSVLEDLLSKLFTTAPSHQQTAISEHYSLQYKALIAQSDPLQSRLETALCEKIFDPLSPTSTSQERVSFWPNNRHQFWGHTNAGNQGKCHFLMHRAMTFQHSLRGNCAHRTCFSAINLFSILQGSGFTITVKSYTDIDQFIIKLSRPKTNTLIYDPLTNPEILFNEDYYNSTMKPLFQKAHRNALPFKLTITERHLAQYAFIIERSSDYLTTQQNNTTIESLIKHPGFSSIQYDFLPSTENITKSKKDEKFKASMSSALDMMSKQLGWKKISNTVSASR